MMRLFDAVAIVAAILAIWLGLYAYAGDVAITPPLRTFAFAAELLSRASFWNHVGATMAAFAMALAISAAGGRGAWPGAWNAPLRGRGGRTNPQLVLHHSESDVVSGDAA